MAYMSQERKKQLAPAIKAALKKFGLKGTLSVDNHSTLVLTISEGKIDFIKNFNDTMRGRPSARAYQEATTDIAVNHYWYNEHFTGDALAALSEIIPAMMVGNHDRSDIQTDYFDVGWYIDVNIGKWNKPYVVTNKVVA